MFFLPKRENRRFFLRYVIVRIHRYGDWPYGAASSADDYFVLSSTFLFYFYNTLKTNTIQKRVDIALQKRRYYRVISMSPLEKVRALSN